MRKAVRDMITAFIVIAIAMLLIRIGYGLAEQTHKAHCDCGWSTSTHYED